MGEVAGRPVLLADADVLIDYARTDRTILHLVSHHLGRFTVLRQVLDTVDQLTESECEELGLDVIEVPTEMLLEAGRQSGRLSFEDRLCLLACKANGWLCVTNDRALIRTCSEQGVSVRRGLRLMLDLVAAGHLARRKAMQVALAIHAGNPHHINEAVLAEFRAALEGR